MKLLLIAFLVFASLAPAAYAKDEATSAADMTPVQPKHIDYALAYPGILPDSPLYPIKMARDKIVLFLITDPAKRAKFNLLQADKRVAAGALMLADEKKNEKLAITTIEKGANYFHEAMNQTFKIKQEGREVNGFMRELDSALEKHIQVVTDLRNDVSKENLPKINDVLTRLRGYQKTVQASR